MAGSSDPFLWVWAQLSATHWPRTLTQENTGNKLSLLADPGCVGATRPRRGGSSAGGGAGGGVKGVAGWVPGSSPSFSLAGPLLRRPVGLGKLSNKAHLFPQSHEDNLGDPCDCGRQGGDCGRSTLLWRVG